MWRRSRFLDQETLESVRTLSVSLRIITHCRAENFDGKGPDENRMYQTKQDKAPKQALLEKTMALQLLFLRMRHTYLEARSCW